MGKNGPSDILPRRQCPVTAPFMGCAAVTGDGTGMRAVLWLVVAALLLAPTVAAKDHGALDGDESARKLKAPTGDEETGRADRDHDAGANRDRDDGSRAKDAKHEEKDAQSEAAGPSRHARPATVEDDPVSEGRAKKSDAEPAPAPTTLDAGPEAPMIVAPASAPDGAAEPLSLDGPTIDSQENREDPPSSSNSTEPAQESPAAQPPERSTAADPPPSSAGTGTGGGSAETPDWPMVWGGVRSLLNKTTEPSRTNVPDGAGQVATPKTPWMIWGLGALFGVGVGMGAMARWIHRAERRKPTREPGPTAPAPAAPPATVPALLAHLAKAPYDAQACFRLAVLMLKAGMEADGIRYLDRAFHVDPLFVVKLLKEEEFALVRQQAPVRHLLLQIKRDHERRAWSGYA